LRPIGELHRFLRLEAGELLPAESLSDADVALPDVALPEIDFEPKRGPDRPRRSSTTSEVMLSPPMPWHFRGSSQMQRSSIASTILSSGIVCSRCARAGGSEARRGG